MRTTTPDLGLVRATLIAALTLFVCAGHAAAQDKGGAIAGTVSDSLRGPLADADVILRPISRRLRTDSAGRFRFVGVPNGAYSLSARKPGYAPEFYEVSLSKGGSVTVNLKLAPLQLDTVRVTAAAQCSMKTLDGFFCRQRFAKGQFLDYPDIDDFGERLTADVFRHVKGFGVSLRTTRDGVLPYPVRRPSRCTMYLVNGKLVESFDRVPRLTSDLSAIEMYLKPDSIPPAVVQEMRFHSAANGMVDVARRCDAVVFWTVDAPLSKTPLRLSS